MKFLGYLFILFIFNYQLDASVLRPADFVQSYNQFKGLLVRYLGVDLISAGMLFLKLYNLSEDRHLIIGEISYAND